MQAGGRQSSFERTAVDTVLGHRRTSYLFRDAVSESQCAGVTLRDDLCISTPISRPREMLTQKFHTSFASSLNIKPTAGVHTQDDGQHGITEVLAKQAVLAM